VGFLGIVSRVLGVIPGVILGVEILFGPKNGADKKDSVLALLAALLGGVQAVDPGVTVNSERVMSGFGKVIDGLVEIFNGAGLFQKS
jgi:hypothetical protein